MDFYWDVGQRRPFTGTTEKTFRWDSGQWRIPDLKRESQIFCKKNQYSGQ